MRIDNLTRDQTLAGRAWEAATRMGRARGLLGRDSLQQGEAIFIKPCVVIHSFFMRFPFDAAFVDRDGVILHVIRRMKPWRMSRIVLGAAGVLELPSGVLDATSTQVGDRLQFVREDVDSLDGP